MRPPPRNISEATIRFENVNKQLVSLCVRVRSTWAQGLMPYREYHRCLCVEETVSSYDQRMIQTWQHMILKI